MIGKLKSLDARLLARRCVGCGYDGALLRGGMAQKCVQCGCDLQKRPAKSYAEMEGLIEEPLAATLDVPSYAPRREPHLMHRWFAVLFLWAVLLGAIVCLSVAAIGAV